ncbi:MAG: nucleoside monophosphate kinase [Xenococcaceae cyanobacterium MO_167.B52]|nr:nucleoside monophosphate kinase [Xenococcaceae cyanobacterium MO_167.B52]
MNILIFGPNGSGKGTQSSLIKDKYELAHIESGAIFREHINKRTPLGLKAKNYISRGELVPDELTIPMVTDILESLSNWLLDGFPRNKTQAEKLWQALRDREIELSFIVEIQLAQELAKQRIMGRRICKKSPHHPNNINIEAIYPINGKCRVCGSELDTRKDDQDEAAIDQRLQVYYDTEEGTLAAVNYYQKLSSSGNFYHIILDGNKKIEVLKDELITKIEEKY